MNETRASALGTVDIDVLLVIIFTFATLGFLFLPQANETFIRPVFGLIFVFFAPGYALIAALFPSKQNISTVQRIALSFGLSIVVVPLAALFFNYLTPGIHLEPIAGFLALFTVICALTAKWRRGVLPYDERFSVNFSKIKKIKKPFSGSESRVDKLLSLILMLSVICLTFTIAYTVAHPNLGENFTEFYLLGANGTIDAYPTQYHLGEQKPVAVGIINHEQRGSSYNLVVRLNNSTESTTLFSQNVSLADNQKWEKVINLKPDRIGKNMKIEFLLYLDNNSVAPYRETDLWATVS